MDLGERVVGASVVLSLAAAWTVIGVTDVPRRPPEAPRAPPAERSPDATLPRGPGPGDTAPVERPPTLLNGRFRLESDAKTAPFESSPEITVGAPEPLEGAPSSNPSPFRGRARRYSPLDLAVLQDIIDLNALTEESSTHDYDDGDGIFRPLEFGYQVWRGGRLVELHSGPNRYFSFGYDLDALPDSIGDLRHLVELDLNSNRLRALPDSLVWLDRLETLRLYRNELTQLPESIWELRNLRVLVLSENDLFELPDEIVDFMRLEVLHARDNPLAHLPDGLGTLDSLEILTANRSERGDYGLRLTRLPATMDNLRRLSVLQLSGNSLYCGPHGFDPSRAPGFLLDGSVEQVYGLSHQVCPDSGLLEAVPSNGRASLRHDRAF